MLTFLDFVAGMAVWIMTIDAVTALYKAKSIKVEHGHPVLTFMVVRRWYIILEYAVIWIFFMIVPTQAMPTTALFLFIAFAFYQVICMQIFFTFIRGVKLG